MVGSKDNFAKLLYISIILSAPISGMGIDIFTPSLPAVVRAFHTTPLLAKLTIPYYMIGLGIGMLVLGILADNRGRYRLLIYSLLMYVFSALAVVYAGNIYVMIALRLLQGFAVGGFVVASRAMLLDMYQGDKYKAVMSSYVAIWSLGPIIAPFIGGFLQHHIGWHGGFVFLAVYGAILTLLFACFGYETMPKNKKTTIKGQIIQMIKVALHPFILTTVLCLIAGYGFLVIFNLMGPFIIQDIYGHSSIFYGQIALLLGLSYFCGTSTNTRLLKRFSSQQMIKTGLCCMTPVILALLFVSYSSNVNLNVLIALVALLYIFLGWVHPNIYAEGLHKFRHAGATANAVIVFELMIGVFIVSAIASMPHIYNAIPLAVTFSVLFAMLIIGYVINLRLKSK